MDIIKPSIDYIGFQGPIITSIITTITLLDRLPYLYIFIIGVILNNSLNEILKYLIKQPRPSNPKSYIDDKFITGPHIFGMPSGHAQTTSFAIIFLYLTQRKINTQLPLYNIWLPLSVFIYILTVYQRWSFRRHTIEQLVIGTIVGATFAQIIYWLTKRYLE